MSSLSLGVYKQRQLDGHIERLLERVFLSWEKKLTSQGPSTVLADNESLAVSFCDSKCLCVLDYKHLSTCHVTFLYPYFEDKETENTSKCHREALTCDLRSSVTVTVTVKRQFSLWEGSRWN